MSFKAKLAALRKKRAELVTTMTELHNKSADSALSDEDQATFDAQSTQIDSLDTQIKNVEKLERQAGTSTVKAGGENGEDDEDGEADPSASFAKKATADTVKGTSVAIRGDSGIRVHSNLPKGTAFTRYAMALAASKGNTHQAVEIAKTMWGDSTPEVQRILRAAVAAGTTTDATWAKPLVEYRLMSDEFIELLRPQTILGRIQGLRRVPFNVRIPAQTGGSSVSWVGEGNPKPVSKLAFDTITMPEHKIAGIVVITQELARFSSPAAEQLVREDLIAAVAEFTDKAFIDPALAGVNAVSPASITNGLSGSATAESTGSTLAQIETDLMKAILFFTTQNIPLNSAVWVMNPATRMALAWKRTAQDVPAFPGVEQGVLKGIPIVDSNSVGVFDVDGAGTDPAAQFIALISAPNVMLADDGQVMLDSSAEASISMTDDGAGTTLTSLWQRNMIGIRAERFITWMKRRAAAVYLITNVAY